MCKYVVANFPLPYCCKYVIVFYAFSDLEGVDVLQVTTFNVTNSSQSLNWEDYGLKLTISQQSLPRSIESCIITAKVSLSGQYKLSNNSELVSPVFWLKCEPSCKFTHPPSLAIQHCALPENTKHLSMARAHYMQKDLPYCFKPCEGSFSQHSNYGVTKLDSFSGFGIVQKQSKPRRYWFCTFYMPVNSPSIVREVHFVVTWHDNVHIKVSGIVSY